jgi:hypothetical protein
MTCKNQQQRRSGGWEVFLLDGSAECERALQRPDLRNAKVCTRAACLTRENISEHFQSMGVSEEIDLLYLYTDQNTHYSWQGLSRYRLRVVVVEYNSAIPASIEWKVNYDAKRWWDGSQNFGASLKAFEILGLQLGYSLVGCDYTGLSAFFVRSDLTGDHFAGPFSAENHHEPPRYWKTCRRSHRAAIPDRAPTHMERRL